MATLVVQAAGPSEHAWVQRTAVLPTWTVPDRLQAVVVSPHPDDETLGLGGTLRAIVAAGGHIELLAVTDGEASHPGIPGLGARRCAERDHALAALGIAGATRIVPLGLPDGGVEPHRASLLAALRTLPTTAASCWFSPVADDGHTDHDTVGAAVAEVAAVRGVPHVRFPVWAWQWHDPTTTHLLDGARRVPLDATDLAAKRAAVAAYASQLTAWSGPAIVPPHVCRRLLRDHEVVLP